MRELTACDLSCHADSSLKYEPSQFSFLADICARFILISRPRSCHCFVHTGCKIVQRSGSIAHTFQRNAHLRAFCRMPRCYRAILTPAKVRRKRGGIWRKVKPNILQVAHKSPAQQVGEQIKFQCFEGRAGCGPLGKF